MNNINEIGRDWYLINNIGEFDSPALVVYRERITENIKSAISMVGTVERLRPHVKTHKTIEVSKLLMEAGVYKFKCATIAEAEMLAMAGAADVLLAYQPGGPKLGRFIRLIQKYPSTKFSCLVDNIFSANEMNTGALKNTVFFNVYLDINVGMNRTGIKPGEAAVELYKACGKMKGIEAVGLHAYDGHIRIPDLIQRTIESDIAFEPVLQMRNLLVEMGFAMPLLIAGGSPTFPIHAIKSDRECSPGTFVYWDKGYQQTCPEQNFLTAALVISRIISRPTTTTICLDLGHKSIASENTLDKRVFFLNAPDLKFITQSEEHLVAEVKEGHSYKVGDTFYGLPFHICPTVALYERAVVIENHNTSSEWKIIARDRKINV
jgi:D-serine deaminase-like pyridoxal phosphate-dependent protein